MKLQKETIELLEDLERRLDATTEDDMTKQWEDFLDGHFDGDIFTPRRKNVTQSGIELPNIHINDAVNDLELMLRAQLVSAAQALSTQTHTPCVRANYGTGILSSLFGAEVYVMPREMNTLPTTRAFSDIEQIPALLDAGVPSLTNGFGQQVFDFGELCAETFAHYPLVNKYVEVYHPDVQGPLDIAELLLGSEMFYAMYDDPELVHGLLELITETYIAFMEKWFSLIPSQNDIHCHWTFLRHKGQILLRNDSAMNLSPDLYKEFSVPYDSRLLKHFDGGVMHFCGRGDHYIEALCSIPGLTGIQMSQPHLNDMEIIYKHTVDKGIPLLAFSRQHAEKDLKRSGGLHHKVHSEIA